MTKCDINLLYADLNKLLEDICGFLSEEIRNGSINSPKTRHEAYELIERSKKQLTAIQSIPTINDNDSGKYVDMMQNTKGKYNLNHIETMDDMNEIYSSVDEDVTNNVEMTNEQCPFEHTPAQKLPTNTKCGYLERKSKILFFGHQRKIYACIYANWMIIYNSERDNKPNEIINLKLFHAKEMETTKEKKQMFELVSKSDQNKNYLFTATTKKDVIQWITAIENHSTNKREIHMQISTDENITNEIKDVPEVDSNIPEEEEDIYAVLVNENEYTETIIEKPEVKIKPKLIPIASPRIPTKSDIKQKWDPKLRPVPNIPNDDNIQEMKSETPTSEETNTNSFSEIDSDASYDEVINDPNKIKTNTVKVFEEDTTVLEEDTEYDEVLNLPLPTSKANVDKIIKENPKPIIKVKPKLKQKPSLKSFNK